MIEKPFRFFIQSAAKVFLFLICFKAFPRFGFVVNFFKGGDCEKLTKL